MIALKVVCRGKGYDLIMNSPIEESEKELKTPLMRVTGRNTKVALNLNTKKTKNMTWKH